MKGKTLSDTWKNQQSAKNKIKKMRALANNRDVGTSARKTHRGRNVVYHAHRCNGPIKVCTPSVNRKSGNIQSPTTDKALDNAQSVFCPSDLT